METNIFFLPKQLWSLPTLPSQMASLTKSVIHVKRWNTKGIHLKTPQDSNYWHFPCVMLCTLPFVVQLQYILQYVKHLKCESGNNSTNRWQYWHKQQQNCCSLPVSCLNMHNFSIRVFIECLRPEFGNTFQERLLASQRKCHTTSTWHI